MNSSEEISKLKDMGELFENLVLAAPLIELQQMVEQVGPGVMDLAIATASIKARQRIISALNFERKEQLIDLIGNASRTDPAALLLGRAVVVSSLITVSAKD